MTDLRQAAQAALEALENSVPADRIPLVKFYDAIDALSAALAEPQPEPIAWFYIEDPWGANEWHWMTDSPESQGCDPRDWTPVYLAPKAQQPLSDEQADQMWRAAWREDSSRAASFDWYSQGLRDAEKAHGIGVKS